MNRRIIQKVPHRIMTFRHKIVIKYRKEYRSHKAHQHEQRFTKGKAQQRKYHNVAQFQSALA